MTQEFIQNLPRPLPQGADPVHLFSRVYDVEMHNYDMLALLEGPARTYRAKQTGPDKYSNKFQAPKNLVLKVNCKVMLVFKAGKWHIGQNCFYGS